MITFLAVIYGIVSVLLIIIVMIQSGKGAGMGIFGGGGGTTFGAQSGDILTKITTVLGILFFGLAIVMGVIISRDNTVSAADKINSTKTQQISAPGVSTTNTSPASTNVSMSLQKDVKVVVKTNK